MDCIHNYLNLCTRRMPQQLTRDETDAMRKLLGDPKFSHWGIASLAYYAMRKNLVMDNFSRFILDYYIDDRVDATLRMDSLRRAYAYALKVTPNLNVNLIVDGGPENVNRVVDHFLQQSCVTRQVALKGIAFSNSMIEATNKSLKYRYLFPKKIEILEHLQKVLKNAVEEYNHIKPHASLHGYTPAELYHGMPLQTFRFSVLLHQAREQRIAYHQSRACGHC